MIYWTTSNSPVNNSSRIELECFIFEQFGYSCCRFAMSLHEPEYENKFVVSQWETLQSILDRANEPGSGPPLRRMFLIMQLI